MSKVLKVFLAGGGTGGHIYPALSIAEALKKIEPTIQIEFVGTESGLETRIVPKAGYKLNLIQSGKLNFSGKLLEKIKTLIKIPVGLVQSVILILKFKPDYVLGVGGYVSAPMLLAAALLGRRTAFWEPNAHPGMANRILSRWIDKSYLVFQDASRYLHSTKNLVFGMPLRAEMENLNQTKKKSDKFSILCFGGSQGSMFLNQKLSDFILNHPELQNQIEVVHQTGALDFENMKQKYKNIHCVQVHDFIYNMPDYYQKADLLICRGGASTLAEAAAFGVVPIVIPLPAADDHQQKNAESLVQKKAGFMFVQKNFNDDDFKKQMISLIQHPEQLEPMVVHLKALAPQNASKAIAEDMLKEIKNI
jgi:UDP-N-acetylglucosamine--N-acetylmuramyl-(pentapeptide) pyrophosphoryl-undecaprenol N-acetylglucosamine transferase